MFINCPFDADYGPFFEALLFTIMACGFQPRSAREVQDSGESRFEKICALIAACRYGVHDISRTELDPVHGLPRFNMPLELGLFLGAKKFGDSAQQQKRCLILDVEKFRYQKFVSDLNGMDVEMRTAAPSDLVLPVRDWLRSVSRRKIRGGLHIADAYSRFQKKLPAALAELGLQSPAPYADFLVVASEWLLAEPAIESKSA